MSLVNRSNEVLSTDHYRPLKITTGVLAITLVAMAAITIGLNSGGTWSGALTYISTTGLSLTIIYGSVTGASATAFIVTMCLKRRKEEGIEFPFPDKPITFSLRSNDEPIDSVGQAESDTGEPTSPEIDVVIQTEEPAVNKLTSNSTESDSLANGNRVETEVEQTPSEPILPLPPKEESILVKSQEDSAVIALVPPPVVRPEAPVRKKVTKDDLNHVLNQLIDKGRTYLATLIRAETVKNQNGNVDEKLAKLDEALSALKSALAKTLNNPHYIFGQLMGHFGEVVNGYAPLRQAIAASNVGNQEAFSKALNKSIRVSRNNLLNELYNFLKKPDLLGISKKPNESDRDFLTKELTQLQHVFLPQFRAQLRTHFQSSQDTLTDFGDNLLRILFEDVFKSDDYRREITPVKLLSLIKSMQVKAKNGESIHQDIESLLRALLKQYLNNPYNKTQIDELMAGFVDKCLGGDLTKHLSEVVQLLLSGRPLIELFLRNTDPKIADIQLALLESEANEVMDISNETLKRLLAEQNAYNFNQPRYGKIAFLIVDENEDLSTNRIYNHAWAMRKIEIGAYNKRNKDAWIKEDPKGLNLNEAHFKRITSSVALPPGKKVVAIPCVFREKHPALLMQEHIGKIRFFSTALPTAIRFIINMFASPEEKELVNPLIDPFMACLSDVVINGVIKTGNPFRDEFRKASLEILDPFDTQAKALMEKSKQGSMDFDALVSEVNTIIAFAQSFLNERLNNGVK